LLNVLDTTTAGAVAIDSDCPALEIGVDVDIDLTHVTTASARIERLRHRVEQVLVGRSQLEHKGAALGHQRKAQQRRGSAFH
jgi:hypothetical protein